MFFSANAVVESFTKKKHNNNKHALVKIVFDYGFTTSETFRMIVGRIAKTTLYLVI